MSLGFGKCIKVFNSEWDYEFSGMYLDGNGNHYERFYIKAGDERLPTVSECLAIADYMGMVFKKGYFYKKII